MQFSFIRNRNEANIHRPQGIHFHPQRPIFLLQIADSHVQTRCFFRLEKNPPSPDIVLHLKKTTIKKKTQWQNGNQESAFG